MSTVGCKIVNKEIEYVNSVFEQPWWLDIVAKDKWAEAVVCEGEEVVARLPYVINKGKIVMPPLTQTIGPWIKSEYREWQPGNVQLSKQKEIIKELFSQMPKSKSIYISLDSVNDYILPYRWLGYRYEPSFSYRITSLDDVEGLYSSFNKTAKKNIKAAKNKTVIKENPTKDELIELMDKTFEAQNRSNPVSHELISDIIDKTLENGHGKIIIATDSEGNNHAGAFLLYDKNITYYLLAGADPEYRSSGAQSLVVWEAIKFASTVSKMFDFEGSNVEGIENFFRQFGSGRVTYYQIYKSSFVVELMNILKPRIKRLIGYKQ